MQRRKLLGCLAAVGGGWPLAAAAQQAGLPRIGALALNNLEPFRSELQDGLRGQGYHDGQNIAFEFRFARGDHDRLREHAAELVRMRVDVIVAQFTPAVTAARDATSEIPIVMAWAGDPIGTGLIASLPRPGGNITGLAGSGLSGKALELVREVLPGVQRIAALAHAPDPFASSFIRQVVESGRAAGIAIQVISVRGPEDLAEAFTAMARDRADAMVAQPSLPRRPVIELALKHRLPLFAASLPFAQEGGLIAYNFNEKDMYRRAAHYVARILKGTRPAILPVEQATRFELIVNLRTARALGLTIPLGVLQRADDVIE